MTDPMDKSWAQPEGSPAGGPIPANTPLVTPRKGSGGSGKGGGLMNAVLIVAAIVAVGGIAFSAGRMTAPTSSRGQFGGNGQGITPGASFDPGASFTPGGQGMPGGFGDRTMTVTGTVKSTDGSTLVLTTADGQEMTISLSGTTYHAQAAATAADVTAGSTVSVSLSGFGGFRPGDQGGAAASGDPGAAGGQPGQGTLTATDVTITSGK